MNNKTKILNLTLSVVALMLVPWPVFTQTDESESGFSDVELTLFAKAFDSVQKVQTEGNEEIDSAIKASKIATERFFEIYGMTQNDPQAVDQLPSSELDPFIETMDEIAAIQQGLQEKMVSAVQKEGLDVSRFNDILASVQQDPSLQKRVEVLDRFVIFPTGTRCRRGPRLSFYK
jgi:hypothetical protein